MGESAHVPFQLGPLLVRFQAVFQLQAHLQWHFVVQIGLASLLGQGGVQLGPNHLVHLLAVSGHLPVVLLAVVQLQAHLQLVVHLLGLGVVQLTSDQLVHLLVQLGHPLVRLGAVGRFQAHLHYGTVVQLGLAHVQGGLSLFLGGLV